MRPILQTVSVVALFGAIVPPIMFFARHMTLSQCKAAMLIATIVWFVVTPLWMGREEKGKLSQGLEI